MRRNVLCNNIRVINISIYIIYVKLIIMDITVEYVNTRSSVFGSHIISDKKGCTLCSLISGPVTSVPGDYIKGSLSGQKQSSLTVVVEELRTVQRAEGRLRGLVKYQVLEEVSKVDE